MTGRVHDMILDPKQTGMLGEVVAEGGYYGMQTFDQHLLEHLNAGRITMEDATRAASSPHDFKLMVAAQARIAPRSHPNKGEGKIEGAPGVDDRPRPSRRRRPRPPRSRRRSAGRAPGRSAGRHLRRLRPVASAGGAAGRAAESHPPAAPPAAVRPSRRPAPSAPPPGILRSLSGAARRLDAALRSRQGSGGVAVHPRKDPPRCRPPSRSSTRPSRQDAFALQNSKLLKVPLNQVTIQAKLGSMVAYQGDVTFEHAGSGGMGRMLKKAVSGEGTSLMRITGSGEVFLADQAQDIHLIYLENDTITVNGPNLLAFDAGIDWDIHRLRAAPRARWPAACSTWA